MAELVRLDHTLIEQGDLRYPVYVLGGTDDLADPFVSSLQGEGNGFFRCSKSRERLSIPGLSKIASEGDILFTIHRGRGLRVALTTNTHQNTLLLTEQCNNNCTFCSQPPRDLPHYFDHCLSALKHFDAAGEIGLTGGEPTLHWQSLLDLMIKGYKPGRTYHLLSHGRTFSKAALVQEMVTNKLHEKTLFGIPIHGASASAHDLVTNVAGSWDETVAGLINLHYVGASIEVRVVVTQQVMPIVSETLALIHSIMGSQGYFIALMRLEPTGWAKRHFNLLKPSVITEGQILEEAIGGCEIRNQSVKLYNYPLCDLPSSIRKYAAQSISDWKNVFGAVCSSCDGKNRCSGLFSSESEQRLSELEPLS